MMASTSGSIESSQKFLVGDLNQEVSSSSGLGDLPSKSLLGKGLNSIGYETEVNGKRFARQDFIGVPSNIFKEEASVLVEIQPHKNVVKTIGWTVDNRSCSLVSEYMEDTLLVFLLKRKQPVKDHPSSQAQLFELQLDTMWQIASGMEYLHDHGFSHGDLKTRNILVSPSYSGRPMTVKVADHGRVRTKRKSMAFACRQARMRDMVRWKAPELLERMSRRDTDDTDEAPEHIEGLSTWDGDETSSESDLETREGANSSSSILWRGNRGEYFSEMYWREGVAAASSSNIYYRECSADVYSFAVTCAQILSNGQDPYPDVRKWKDLKELRDRIVAHDIRPELPSGTCPGLATLLKSCWGTVPSLRPQFWYIRRALEGLLPHCQEPILAAPLKQYTPAARVFIVAHLLYSLTCSDEKDPVRGASKQIQRAVSEKPELIRSHVEEIKGKLSVLYRKMFLLKQKGWMELNALMEVAEVMKVLLNLASKNLRTSPPWLQELSNEIDEFFRMKLPWGEGQKWYHLLPNMLSRRPRSWENLVSSIQEDFLEMFNLVTQLGEVLFKSASESSKEFLELLEERGRNKAIVKLRVPNLVGDDLQRITDILRGKWLNTSFYESMKVLRVAGFYFHYDDLERYVLGLVRSVTWSASILSPGEPTEGPQTGIVSDKEEYESEGPQEIHKTKWSDSEIKSFLTDIGEEEYESEEPREIHELHWSEIEAPQTEIDEEEYGTEESGENHEFMWHKIMRLEERGATSRKEDGNTKASGEKNKNKKAADERKAVGEKIAAGEKKVYRIKKASGIKKSPGKKKASGIKKSPGKKKASGIKKSPGKKKASGIKKSPGKKKVNGNMATASFWYPKGLSNTTFKAPLHHDFRTSSFFLPLK